MRPVAVLTTGQQATQRRMFECAKLGVQPHIGTLQCSMSVLLGTESEKVAVAAVVERWVELNWFGLIRPG